MKNDQPNESTGPGQEGRSADDTTNQFEAVVGEMIDVGRIALDRVSYRVRDNLKRAKEGQYGLDAWLDDVKWFWAGVSEDSSRLIDGIQNRRTQT